MFLENGPRKSLKRLLLVIRQNSGEKKGPLHLKSGPKGLSK
jgi:hypothetical protein